VTVMGPPKPAFTLDVEEDPLPWLTDQFRQAGAFETQVPTLDPAMEDALKGVLKGKAPKVVFSHNMPTLKAMSAALGITSSIVTALSDHEKRFSVRFHPTASTASTYLKTREVVIGIRPMLDPRLTEGQRAALMVALAYHEVGHVIWTADMEAKVAAKYPGNKPVQKVFNVIHDLLLERQQQVRFPGYAPTLRVKQAYWGKRWVVRLNSKRNRFGALVQATLYPQGSEWSTSAEVSDWFTWADDWATRCRDIKAGKSPTYLFGLIDEAIEHLRLDEPDQHDPLDDEEEERPGTGEQESEDEEPDFDDDYDEEGDMDDPFGEDDADGPQRPPEEDDEWPDLDDSEDDSEDGPGGDLPTDEPESEDDEEEDEEDQPTGKGTPTEDETEESDEDDEEDVPGEGDDESEDKDEAEDEESEEESGKGGTTTPGDIDPEEEAQPDEPRDEFDDPRIPQAHPEGDEDAEAWQGRIDDFERVQVKGRDKLVVGGGSFHKREVRILRIDR
jgi:hypothetical protein